MQPITFDTLLYGIYYTCRLKCHGHVLEVFCCCVIIYNSSFLIFLLFIINFGQPNELNCPFFRLSCPTNFVVYRRWRQPQRMRDLDGRLVQHRSVNDRELNF